MRYHLILACADGVDDAQTLGAAADLAVRHRAVVRIVPTYPDVAVDLVSFGMILGADVSGDAVQALADDEQASQSRIEAAARAAAEARGLPFGPGDGGPRLVLLPHCPRPPLALGRETALTDLMVVSQAFLKASPPIDDVLGRVLFEQRTPVLVCRGTAAAPAGSAVIAWDGSAPAGRAVRAALPLLADASRVTIVQCRSGLDDFAADTDPRRLQDYLAVAGIAASIVEIKGRREGEAILAAACTRSATLLVAGAYSRPRLAEAVLGGASRAFLGADDGPSLLLAH